MPFLYIDKTQSFIDKLRFNVSISSSYLLLTLILIIMAKLSNSELQEKLIPFIEDITMGQETVKPDTSLYDLGLDSLDYTDLCYELSCWGYDFNKALDYCSSNEDVTISSLVAYLNKP